MTDSYGEGKSDGQDLIAIAGSNPRCACLDAYGVPIETASKRTGNAGMSKFIGGV